VKLKTKLLIGTFIVSELLGTSACSMTDNKSETAQTINELKATEIALDASQGGVVIDSHLDENNGSNKYEVSIEKSDKNYEVDVDSLTGEVLEIDQRSPGKINIENESKLQNVSPKISSEDARHIALDQVRGTITEMDLDNFNNRLVYDFEISSVYHREVNVIVDAINGKVLKVEEITY
jgi:uncharacterized membrane protein YkoI